MKTYLKMCLVWVVVGVPLLVCFLYWFPSRLEVCTTPPLSKPGFLQVHMLLPTDSAPKEFYPTDMAPGAYALAHPNGQ